MHIETNSLQYNEVEVLFDSFRLYIITVTKFECKVPKFAIFAHNFNFRAVTQNFGVRKISAKNANWKLQQIFFQSIILSIALGLQNV